jgi:hypothetical protein
MKEDSGPFCRHYGDPASCEICGHRCTEHDLVAAKDGGYGCMVEECVCMDWKEPVIS